IGLVVSSRQGAHRRETAESRLVDGSLCTTRDHDIGVPAADDLARLAEGVSAGRAGGYGREVGAGHPELDGDLAGADVRDAHRDEERADPVRTAQSVRGEPIDERPDAAEPCPEDNARPLGEIALEPFRKPGLVERLARRDEPELDVAVGPTELLS